MKKQHPVPNKQEEMRKPETLGAFRTEKSFSFTENRTQSPVTTLILSVPCSKPAAIYTGCPRRNVPNFGRVFLGSNYTDITQNTYIQSSMVTEILAREKFGILWCLRTILCPWRDPLDLDRDNPAVACSSQRRPWFRNRCSECIVVGSQWTTVTRVRVFL